MEFGESVWVIGLGVIGQLTSQIALNAGYQVIATDLDEKKVSLVKKAGADLAGRADEITPKVIKEFLGQGVDAVVMTAGSKSENLVNDSLTALRPGGRYVMVGVSPLNLNRDIMFDLESEVMVTRAGGPGRYNRDYELNAHDFPLQYVRWTEGRNMQEFIRMLEKGRISTKELITHRYKFEDAKEAYQMIQSGNQDHIGVILKY
ncbi:MAG: zinc-binding alcohol dehydrogenase [Firmicutes bacterium]|nr:zinc-binding alcohol dehydrogenase [Bacillota bacterium]